MARSDRKRIAVAAVVALAVPLLVACNSIIGLSDFEKGECAGRRCADGGGVPPVDGGPDVFADAPPDVRGTDPVSWAQWEMPNYDAGFLLPNPLKYTVLGSGGPIQDGVTGLVWRIGVLPAQLSFDRAKAACVELDPSDKWRLPKRIELVTLLDFGRTVTLIDPLFTGVPNVRIWTSSELRPLAAPAAQQQYWTVDFGTGLVDTLPAATNVVANVLCVKDKS